MLSLFCSLKWLILIFFIKRSSRAAEKRFLLVARSTSKTHFLILIISFYLHVKLDLFDESGYNKGAPGLRGQTSSVCSTSDSVNFYPPLMDVWVVRVRRGQAWMIVEILGRSNLDHHVLKHAMKASIVEQKLIHLILKNWRPVDRFEGHINDNLSNWNSQCNHFRVYRWRINLVSWNSDFRVTYSVDITGMKIILKIHNKS